LEEALYSDRLLDDDKKLDKNRKGVYLVFSVFNKDTNLVHNYIYYPVIFFKSLEVLRRSIKIVYFMWSVGIAS
jgi:hypothetical protein